MIKEAENEIDAIAEKKAWLLSMTKRLLKDNETEMKAAKKKKKELTDLKNHLLAWGARDEAVTDEWSPSE